MVARSTLERTNRLDSEFHLRAFRADLARIRTLQRDPLPDVAGVSDGNHFTISDAYTDVGVPYFRGQDISGTFFADPERAIPITREAYERRYMRRSHLERGDVLLSIVGTIGSSALVTFDTDATCSCKLAILRPNGIGPGYLATYIATRFGQNRIAQLTRGAVQRGFILEDADQFEIPRFATLEPLIEQIVDQAAVLTRQSAAAVEAADNSLLDALNLRNWAPPEPLSNIRSSGSVVASARLDAEHYEEKYYAARRALELAGAQSFLPLGALLTDLTNGQTPLHHDLSQGDVTFLCGEHVKDFEIDYDSRKRIESKHHAGILARTALTGGEVLLTIKGKTGNAALVENLAGPTNINQDVALLRLNDRLPLWYLLGFINSFFGKLATTQLTTGAINPFLSLDNVKRVPIPVFDQVLMDHIADAVRKYSTHARQLRKASEKLLQTGRRAIEIAIERNEAAALEFLSEERKAMDARSA